MQKIIQMAILVVVAMGVKVFTDSKDISKTPDPNGTEKVAILESQTKIENGGRKSAEVRSQAERLKIENTAMRQTVSAYEKSVKDLRGSLKIMIAVVSIAIGYLIFKNNREYKKTLQDTREARKEARDWEKKSREKFQEIDKTVKEKLTGINEDINNIVEQRFKDIEKKGRDEAEKQRKINKLWDMGIREHKENRIDKSMKCWEKITEIDPENYIAFGNWGSDILGLARDKEGQEASRLFSEAYEKYKKALDIEPDYYKSLWGLGLVLSDQAKTKKGEEADKLFSEAYVEYKKATEIEQSGHDVWKAWGIALKKQAKNKEGQEKEKLLEEADEKFAQAKRLKGE